MPQQVWDALQPLECPEQLKPSGHLQTQQLNQHTASLKALDFCGPVLQTTTVGKVVLQVARLRQWQQQQDVSAAKGKAPAAAAAVAALSKQMAGLDLLGEEYGANLAVSMPEGPAAMSWFLGQTAGDAASHSARHQNRQSAATTAAGVTATPSELRQMFASEAAADDLGWSGQAAGPDLDGDVDIDSDDERKGRGKKVGMSDAVAAGGQQVVPVAISASTHVVTLPAGFPINVPAQPNYHHPFFMCIASSRVSSRNAPLLSATVLPCSVRDDATLCALLRCTLAV